MRSSLEALAALVFSVACTAALADTDSTLHSIELSTTQSEALKQGVPPPVDGVQWLSTPEEVRRARPQIVEDGNGSLAEMMLYLGRDTKMNYRFMNGLLINFTRTFFSFPSNDKDVALVQEDLQRKYGPMGAFVAVPGHEAEKLRCSDRVTDRFKVRHCLQEVSQGTLEQILIYRTPKKKS